MKVFKDSSGRQWDIELNFDSAKRVKDLLGINLLAPEEGDPPLLTRLGTDEILLCDVIYCIVKPQAENAGITDIQFGQSLGGEAIMSASEAFYNELIDFFQSRGRGDRAKAVAAQKKMIELAVEKVSLKIEQLDIEARTEKIFGSLSMNLPD